MGILGGLIVICSLRQHGMAVKALLILKGWYVDTCKFSDREVRATPDHVNSIGPPTGSIEIQALIPDNRAHTGPATINNICTYDTYNRWKGHQRSA